MPPCRSKRGVKKSSSQPQDDYDRSSALTITLAALQLLDRVNRPAYHNKKLKPKKHDKNQQRGCCKTA